MAKASEAKKETTNEAPTQEELQVNQDMTLSTSEQQQLPATDELNPFEELARSVPRRIIGELLKFSKGDWMYGQHNEELKLGTALIANMDQLLTGWIKWQDNKPAETIMGLVVEGFKPPKRDTLGDGYTPGCKADDVDTSEWEVDAGTGQPRDPWQRTWYLLMRQLDDKGQPLQGDDGLFTFTTSSKGGTDAIMELCAKYGKWMRAYPGKYPVIKLGTDKYNHPNRQLGVIKTPEFLFNPKTDWIEKAAFGDISEAAAPSEGEEIPF